MKTLRSLLCFLLLMSASVFSGNAQTISREQAQTLASEFLAQGTRATRAVTPALAYQWDSRHLSPVATIAAEEAAPAFYAFARESGEGFVIISSDANNPRVLGYSLDSNLPDVQNLPDGMRDFLTEYSVAPAKTVQSRASYDYNATSMGKIVVNLNTAPWGQRTPFNKFCYVAGGAAGSAITGCVPTAYSILMHYHKWPLAAKPVEVIHSGTGEKRMLGHEYDWANMLHSYSGTYTEKQADAVATLMSDMGWAYQVKYSANNTSTEFGYGEGAAKFIDIFKYKSNTPASDSETKATTRHQIDDATWKQYIKQSLDAGLPIPYSSTTSSAMGAGRHIYILDGYTENDYYHFNWGWNGTGNGWFQLSDMTPLEDGSNYSNSHRAYFMLSPDKGVPCTITVSADCGTCGRVLASYGSTEGESITVDQGANVTLAATPYSGYIFEKWTCGTEDVSTSATCKVSANSSAEYVAHFVAVSATYQISTSVFGDEGGTAMLQIEGDAPTTNGDVIPGREVTLIAEPEEGYQFVKWTSGTNDFSSEATYTFVPNASAQYVAHFKVITHTVGVSTSDAVFGLVQIDGATPAESASKEVNYGTEVTLTAEPKSGYVFKHWTSGGDVVSIDNPLRVDVTDNVNYVAVFIPQSQNTGVSIVATTDGGGTATVNSNNSVNAERNEEITLAATPASGYYFVEWRVGDKVVSTKATFTTSAQTARTYKAVFAALPTGNATINAYGRGGGNASVQNMTGTTLGTTNVSVPYGTTFKLNAKKSSTADFICWTKNTTIGYGGEIISNDMEMTVVATESMKYFANFGTATSVSATADANTGGTAEVTGDKTFAGEVTFKATANTGYNFTNWTNAGGDVVSTEPYYTTLLTSDLALTANFEVSGSTGPSTPDVPTPETYNISVSVNGTNGTATASSNSVTEGQSVTLTATPMNGYRFVNWTKGGEVVSTDNPYTFVPTASGDYVANFEAIPVYNISTSVNGTNGTAAASSNSVTEGEEVTLTATPNDGYRFVNWTKGTEVVSSANPYTFVPTASGEYMANFEVIPVVTPQYTISVASSDNGFGSVAVLEFGASVSGTVYAGTTLTLVATPIETCKFVKWTCNGQDIEGGATLEVTASENADYVAVFAVKESYYVSISSNPSGAGEISISVGTNYSETGMNVLEGAIVTLQATANAGYTFKNWTRDGVEISKDESFSVPVDAAADYVANFESVSQGTGVTISAVASDGGSATVNSQTTISGVEVNTPLTLVATPNAGYYFVKWQVDEEDVSTKATFTTTAQSDREYRAVFAMGGEEVVVRSSGSLGNGWIGTIGTNQVSAVKGTSIKLLAVVVEKPFLCWTKGSSHTNGGEVLSNKMVFDVVVTERTTYIANFKDPISVSVEASVNGDGGTTEITGDKSYAGEVTFVANPQTGYKFTRWTNGGETVSTEPHYTTIVTGDLNLVANFEKMSVAPSEPETTGLDVNLTMISDDDELIYGLEGAIGTFSAPYATLIPENVDVYYALKSDLDGTNALHLIHYNTSATSTVIPANQGVILVGNFNVNTTVHMIPATDEQAGRMANNAFSNTAAGSVVMQTGDYVLARGEQGIGFYQATGTLKPNKAYLSLDNTSNVSAFRLVFGETTDLNSSVTIINPDAPIYDLSGRRVMQTVKGGVYIQNGKKFIVK